MKRGIGRERERERISEREGAKGEEKREGKIGSDVRADLSA